MDALLDSFRKIVKSGAEKMDSTQRRESEDSTRFSIALSLLVRAVVKRPN